jgi:hypothetical protein
MVNEPHQTKKLWQIKGMKRQPIEWEKNIASYLWNKELIYRIYKELKNLIGNE